MSWFSSFMHGAGSVVHDVVKGVGHAVGDVIHVVGKNIVPIVAAIAAYYTAGIASAAVGAAGSAGAAGGAAAGGTAAAAGTAGAAAAGTSAAATSGVVSWETTAALTAAAVVKKITAPVAEVAHYATEFSDDIYKPIIKPLIKYYDQAKSLYTAVSDSLKQGISGIVQIPSEIGAAFGNLGAINRQIANIRIEGSSVIASDILAPSIIEAGAKPIAELTKLVANYTELPELSIHEIPEQQLNEPPDYTQLIDDYKSDLDYLNKLPGFVGEFARALQKLLYIGPVLALHLEHPLKQIKQNVNKSEPLDLLPMGSIVEAIQRNEIEILQAVDEASKHGIDKSRLNILLELNKSLIPPSQVIDAEYRQIIEPGDAETELKKQGWDETRIDVLRELSFYMPGPADIFTWYARGGLTRSEADILLAHAHYTPEQAKLILETGFTPVSAPQFTKQQGLIEAVANGYLANTLSSEPPPEVAEAHKNQGLTEGQARANWLAHWQDLSMGQWVDAYFRQLINKQDLELAFEAHNVPEEIRELNIGVSRELIPIWLAPEILSSGLVPPAEGELMLRKLGLDDANVKLLIDYADAKANAPKIKQLDTLAQLSLGNLKELYDQKIIDTSQYKTGLIDHGYSIESATLLADSENIKRELRDRRAYGAGIVAEVKTGSITKQQAIDDLYSHGYTTPEVNEYVVRMGREKKSRAKLPGETSLLKMLNKEIITPAEYLDALQDLGYSQTWADRLYTLNTQQG